MTIGTFRQQIGFTFCVASAIVSVVGDYIWAYLIAPDDRKFPTPSSLFEINLQISIVVLFITVGLFLLPTYADANFTIAYPTTADHCLVAVLGCAVRSIIFASPRLSDQVNPVLASILFTPIAAGTIFVRLRRRDPPSANPINKES